MVVLVWGGSVAVPDDCGKGKGRRECHFFDDMTERGRAARMRKHFRRTFLTLVASALKRVATQSLPAPRASNIEVTSKP